MRRDRRGAFLIAQAVGLAGLLIGMVVPRPIVAQGRTLLFGATLIDGNGGPPLVGARVIVEQGRFTCVGGAGACPAQAGDRQVDLTDRWITPGLIDTHVHLPCSTAPNGLLRAQRLRFAFGITTVRDAGSRSTDELLAARTVAANPAVPLPRIVVASRVEPADAARLGVPLGAPVDAIKIKPPFDREIWREEIRAAHRAGLPAFGHTWDSKTTNFTREAIAAGINGISHIMGVVLAAQPPGVQLTAPADEDAFWRWEKALWLTIDSAQVETLFRAMIDANVWLEPTLASEYHFGRPLLPPPEVAFLGEPPSLRALFRRGAAAPRLGPTFPASWPQQAGFVRQFMAAGGRVVAGSDGLAPGFDLHEEIALLGEVAGSPMRGLLAATRDAAVALNRPDLGTIAVGHVADALVYADDPLRNRGASLLVERVIKSGVSFEGDSLRAEFRAEYAARERSVWRARVLRGAKLGAPLLLVLLGLVWIRRKRGTRNAPTQEG